MAQFQQDEESVDGCSEIKLNKTDALSDAELPPASGGVQVVVEKHDDVDRFDGCDLDFNTNDLIPDRELPAAAGGVQGVGSPAEN